MGKIDFFKESVKNLKTVGTVTRSTKYLCKQMIKPIDFETARTIVEIGAGDGVITRHILEAMHPDAKLLSFEINEKFVEKMQEIDDDRLQIVHDSAGELAKYLDGEKADHIISAVPFVAFPKDEALAIVKQCYQNMAPKGLFVQLHYSLLTKKLYEQVFGHIDVNFVALNVPPAFVLIGKR